MTSIPADKLVAKRRGEAPGEQRADIVKVVLWMFGALLCFSGMAVSIRELSHALNLFEILVIRNASGLVILGAAVLVRPALRHQLAPRHMRLHLVRNMVHFASQYAWAFALTLLPFATVFALEFTAPAWTVLLAVAWLGERLMPSRIGTVVLGFLGVLVILRPGLESFRPAALLVLAAAFGFAVTLSVTKKLTTYVTPFAILFWMNLIQLPMGLAGSNVLQFANLHGWAFLPVLGLALAGAGSHWCLSNAFRFGDAILVVPLDFLRIPLIAVVGWAFYGEPLDVFVFVGAALIVSGVLWNLMAEARRAPIAAKSASVSGLARRPASHFGHHCKALILRCFGRKTPNRGTTAE